MPHRLLMSCAILFGALASAFAHGDLHESIAAVSQEIARSPGDAGTANANQQAVRDNVPIGGAPRRFIRLRVTRP